MNLVWIYQISPLSSDETQNLLNDWSQTKSITNVYDVGLESANFSSDETCEVLADLIDKAVMMEYLDIEYQDAVRPIRVVVVPASAEGAYDGSITITNYDTGAGILTQTTGRTLDLDMFYGDIGQTDSDAVITEKPRKSQFRQ